MNKIRLKALFWDYLFICLYLLGLFILTLLFYSTVLNGFPTFTEIQAQLIAAFTSVIPLIILFSIMEGRKPFASFGKRKYGLKVNYLRNPLLGSIIRNSFKFLPWQLGHISAIRFAYGANNLTISFIYFFSSLVLVILYISMALMRKDHRHLPDLLAGSTVTRI